MWRATQTSGVRTRDSRKVLDLNEVSVIIFTSNTVSLVDIIMPSSIFVLGGHKCVNRLSPGMLKLQEK